MTALRHANLLARFLLELAAFAAIGWSAFRLVAGPLGVVAGLAAAALAATVWGVAVAPRAPIALPLLARLAVETVVFGTAVAALVAIDRGSPAAILGLCAVVNRVLLLPWDQ